MTTLREDHTLEVLTLLAGSGGDAVFGALVEAFARLGRFRSAGLARVGATGMAMMATYPLPQACDDGTHPLDEALRTVLAAPGAASTVLGSDAWYAEGVDEDPPPRFLNGIAIRDDDGRPLGLLFNVGPAATGFAQAPALPVVLARAAAELRRHRERDTRQLGAELYRRAVELAGHRALLHDRNGILVEISTGDTTYWPYPRERLLGRHFSQSLPSGIAAQFAELHRQVLLTGETCTAEYKIDIAGTERIREMRVTRFDEDHTLTVIRDITDARRALEALRESEARTRAMLQAMPDTLLVNDADGVYVEQPIVASGAWRPVLYDALGRRFEDALPPHVAALFRACQREVLADGEPRKREYEIEIDGRIWQRELRMVRLDAERTLTIVRDVTDLHAALASLRESESRLRNVVELAPVGIFWTDRDGAVRYGNPALRRAIRLTAAEAHEHAWLATVHPDDLERVAAAWQRLLDHEAPAFVEEYRFVPPGRPERLVRTHAIPIENDGQVVAYMGIVLDVTEQRREEAARAQLQARLQHVQKSEALGQLTGGIAHEFNNLLASTLGYASLLQRRLPPDTDPRLVSYVQQIVTAGERGRDLVARMLAFVQRAGDSDGVTLAQRVVDEAVQMMRALLPSPVSLTLDVDPATPAVAAADDDLRQVLLNLLLNARDAIVGDDPTRHGAIGISVQGPREVSGLCGGCKEALRGEYVVIEVSDDGCGIEPQALERIFDPFYTTKAFRSGAGLGLSVVHGTVHRHGGHVLAESRAGEGTRLHVLLQPAASPTSASETPAAMPAATPSGPTRVLVVDDEPAVGQFLAELLRSEDYEAEVYTDPRAALDAVARAPSSYALVVSDLSMPGLSGVELASAIGDCRRDLPVIVCTGYNDIVDSGATSAPAVARWFRKPLPIGEFLDAVAELTARTTR